MRGRRFVAFAAISLALVASACSDKNPVQAGSPPPSTPAAAPASSQAAAPASATPAPTASAKKANMVTVTANVTCQNGRKLVGAYIDTKDEQDDGFVENLNGEIQNPGPGTAIITFDVPSGKLIRINVGCGADDKKPDDWAKDGQFSTVGWFEATGQTLNLNCGKHSDEPKKRCAVTP